MPDSTRAETTYCNEKYYKLIFFFMGTLLNQFKLPHGEEPAASRGVLVNKS